MLFPFDLFLLAALPFPEIDPVFFSLGPLKFRWYGLMYLLGLSGAYFLIRSRARAKNISLSQEQLYDLIVYAALGVFLGGRIGYTLFYNAAYYVEHPLSILAVWEGGMSFHGGLIGTCIALWIFCRRKGFAPYTIADLAAQAVPIGLGFGRIGNFINGELYGRPTDVDWCMVFPRGGDACRHPSQLYEAGLEGVALFLLLWIIGRRDTPPGTVFWTFICGYGIFRSFVELFREPDAHLGLLLGPLTMGQLLSFPMVLLGLLMILIGYRNRALKTR
ncbi:prolipoprotein diacylglyceryl transferase [Candidatus Nitronereus thalassa]|uniref:Phosphatidylglycerol--prolipoprotein diacylglyceryl transferase n=1 Tax=Candidatus Nitronereus thalassa TaxID=3020898 RepID=A0ABU3K6U0_9BACT|nr:prolipoprotein diacylglyceryl transferase [Candidatus Nitronereus thalassa]MDT7042084.1 prolipoprotein diacylglyceryl transferase [Candidatus Nitronereus thalassa]